MIKTIVWDIDDVMNDLMRSWLEYDWLPTHPDCRLCYSDITENPPHRLLGVSASEYLASLDRFRMSPAAAKMKPPDGLFNWFENHGARFRHVALTARPVETVAPAFTWTLQHFGQWFETFAFVPSERPGQLHNGPERSKEEYLAWLSRVNFFIDDSQANVATSRKLGLRSFLVSRPWNTGGKELKTILRHILDETE